MNITTNDIYKDLHTKIINYLTKKYHISVSKADKITNNGILGDFVKEIVGYDNCIVPDKEIRKIAELSYELFS